MKIIIGLILLSILSSCGIKPLEDLIYKKSSPSRSNNTTDPAFTPYVAKFEQYGKSQLENKDFNSGDVVINFGDTENPEFDGVCLVYPDGSKEVIIKREFWDKATEKRREILILHELGHCVLGREHDEETHQKNGNTFKLSIMHPIVPSQVHYQAYTKEYLKEFYRRDKTTLKDAVNK